MMRSIRRSLVLGMLGLLLAWPASADDEPTPFEAALSWLGPDTAVLAFDDWDAMKAAHGFEALTSAIPGSLRMERMIDLTEREAPVVGFGLGRLFVHAEAWGWDTTDLAWEAQLFGPGPPLSVLRFRDGLDLGPFRARLDERGFDARSVDGATIRSHPFDVSVDWATTTELAIFNLAFLDDDRTVLASSSPEAIDEALARRHGTDPSTIVTDPAAGPIHSAIVELDPGACSGYDPRASGAATDADLIAAVSPLRAWTSLTLTTTRDAAGEPLGRLTLTFPGLDDAALSAEAEARARLAREGTSTRTGTAYAESVFRLGAVDASAGSVRLDLEAVDGLGRLRDAVFARDLLPAMC